MRERSIRRKNRSKYERECGSMRDRANNRNNNSVGETAAV
jgi:hypothetical protein